MEIKADGILAKSEIQLGDVIVKCEGSDTDQVSDLMKSYQENNWRGKLNLTIFRNQKEISITVTTKK